ncbi:hypothetical protein GTW17_05910 [Vibrio cholerae]|nr:hypothetical protein [Vibrio cholerae]TXY98139.1 hypothetical protein FXE68_02360 [Vibrio cholerae]
MNNLEMHKPSPILINSKGLQDSFNEFDLYPNHLELQVGGKRVTNLSGTNLHSHRLAFGESQGWLS